MMLLKTLTDINGISGYEDQVREYIQGIAEKYADKITVDSMGNLIAFKKGKKPGLKIMLSAHMDEVGFMVIGHTDNGMLKFKNVGGIDERIMPGKRVLIGDSRIPGVIGCKPIHLLEPDERQTNMKQKNMYIDIGVEKKEEAEKLAPLGEQICFLSEYTEFGDSCVKAKALDDRAGCAIILEALREECDYDLYACFTVQEEVGLRGSGVAAYAVKPDIAFVFEGTASSNVAGVPEHLYSTRLGEGPVLTVMDMASYGDKGLFSFVSKLASDNDLKTQVKQTVTGGNDAGRIQQQGKGVKVLSISMPCRYIHSPVSVMSLIDFEDGVRLAKLIINNIDNYAKIYELGGNNNV